MFASGEIIQEKVGKYIIRLLPGNPHLKNTQTLLYFILLPLTTNLKHNVKHWSLITASKPIYRRDQ
jgi:hypothetical protein